jgi:predicted ATPase/DNA-binding SARP family transcriptional activator
MGSAATIEFAILGPLELRRGGESLPVRAARKRSLLMLLLLHANEAVSTERLVDALWGEAAPGGALHTLQVYVSQLRKLLGPEVLVTRPPGYLLRVERGALDAERFGILLVEGREHLERGNARAAAEKLRAALALWRGPALADLAYEPWAQGEIDRLEDLRVVCLEERIEAELKLGEHERLVGELESLIAEQPLRERPRGQLMLALYRSGRQAEALEAYREARGALLEEHGIDPSPKLQALYKQILNQDKALAVPPEQRHLAPPSNLPAGPATRMVGRSTDMAQVLELLQRREVRLLTLVGTGGIGKTRLAVAAARELLSTLGDGAAFVDLAPLQDPDLLVPTIARCLGVAEQPDEFLTLTLHRYLDGRQVLLVLDNLEHLVGVAPTVAELLRSCAEVKVLATSRVPLRVSAEHLYELQPLEEKDAASLLAERVRSVNPLYEVDSQDAAVVRAICRRLDGLPLALELAAPRFKILTPKTLLARLERSLEVLTGGFQDLPERQQTLRATIEWSFRMLSPEEQRLLTRMSVFAGGCTLAAAEVVCAGEGSSILDTLGSLVDHSLVRVASANGGERFALLETIREFATGELERAGETDDLIERHTAWIATVVEDVWSQWLADDRAWRPRAEAELDNARAALVRALDNGRSDIGARIAGALYPFWSAQAPSEGRRWLEAALDAPAPQPAPARSLFALAGLLWPTGAYDRADLLLERAVDEARVEGADALVRRALAARGGVKFSQGEPVAAEALIQEAAVLARADRDIPVLRRALNILAGVRFEKGDLAGAKSLLLEALELACESGDERGKALVNSNLGRVALAEGDFEASASYAKRAVAATARTGDAYQSGHAALGLALAYLLGGKLDDARTWFLTALDVAERPPDYAPSCLWGLAAAAAAAGDHRRAARFVGAANAAFESFGTAPDLIERHIDEAILNEARARLGDGWAEEESAGRRMSIDDAVAS